MSMLKKSEFSEGPLYFPFIISSLKTCCIQKLWQTNLKFGSKFLFTNMIQLKEKCLNWSKIQFFLEFIKNYYVVRNVVLETV